MIISSRQIKADPQPQTKGINTKNVRQWNEHEIPLINKGDEEIPLTQLHVKADLFDRHKSRPFKTGDRVKVKKHIDLGKLKHLYDDNIGSIVSDRGYIYDVNPMLEVRWDRNVSNTSEPLYNSKFQSESLERA